MASEATQCTQCGNDRFTYLDNGAYACTVCFQQSQQRQLIDYEMDYDEECPASARAVKRFGKDSQKRPAKKSRIITTSTSKFSLSRYDGFFFLYELEGLELEKVGYHHEVRSLMFQLFVAYFHSLFFKRSIDEKSRKNAYCDLIRRQPIHGNSRYTQLINQHLIKYNTSSMNRKFPLQINWKILIVLIFLAIRSMGHPITFPQILSLAMTGQLSLYSYHTLPKLFRPTSLDSQLPNLQSFQRNRDQPTIWQTASKLAFNLCGQLQLNPSTFKQPARHHVIHLLNQLRLPFGLVPVIRQLRLRNKGLADKLVFRPELYAAGLVVSALVQVFRLDYHMEMVLDRLAQRSASVGANNNPFIYSKWLNWLCRKRPINPPTHLCRESIGSRNDWARWSDGQRLSMDNADVTLRYDGYDSKVSAKSDSVGRLSSILGRLGRSLPADHGGRDEMDFRQSSLQHVVCLVRGESDEFRRYRPVYMSKLNLPAGFAQVATSRSYSTLLRRIGWFCGLAHCELHLTVRSLLFCRNFSDLDE